MTSFVHLRSHSQYSIKEGLIPVKKDKKRPHLKLLATYAAENNQEAIALTDIHGVFGMINFYKTVREKGIKPIIGSDVWIEPDVTQPENSRKKMIRLNLICQNQEGYKRLMELISRSNLDNHIDKVPRIKQSWLLENSNGLIALSGDGTHGELASLLVEGATEEDLQKASEVVAFYKEAFPNRYFLEVQRYDQPNEFEQVSGTLELSEMHGVPVVATHPINFGRREDYYAHEIRAAIASKKAVVDVDYVSDYTPEQYFKSTEEMEQLFADIPQAVVNAGLIAQKCSAEIELNKSYLPHVDSENGKTEAELLIEYAQKGLEKRLLENFSDPQEREKVRAEYQSRLDEEVQIINNMGFPGYFLIVADFIGWAKENDIPIGPGRGSGAGSLVAYSLSITNLDPIPHGLLFERFLNPERVSMPDFDIDMDMFRREEIIDYVRARYGFESVSQIATFGTNDVRGAIRATVRATGTPYEVGDIISKAIVNDADLTIAKILEQGEIKAKYESSPAVKKILDLAQLIEGSIAGVGTHAAGVLISPTKISDFSPLHYTSDKDMEAEKKKKDSVKSDGEVGSTKKGGASLVSQYDKDDVESAGLVKFDFLGLATLSFMKLATDMIQKDLNQKIDLDKVDLNDPKAMEVFLNGDTVGIFQFESSGMQSLLKGCKASSFADVTALNALYRPGPMDLIPTFQNRKLGLEPIEYPDPRVEDLLKETQGIMVYQEQVMKVAQILGGYSLGGADMLRRAMGKKKPEEMAANREIFAKGASEKGLSREQADDLFDLIETFSGYGFNKSHAAAYSMVSVQAAYLKSNYAPYFYAAHLTMAGILEGTRSVPKMGKMVTDMKSHGLSLLPPDINKSDVLFGVNNNDVAYGLAAVSGIGLPVANKIVKTREESGDYTSVYDFIRRFGRKSITENFLLALVGSGAFDSLHPNRPQLLAAVPDLVAYSAALNKKSGAKNVKVIQQDAFGFGDVAPKATRRKKAAVVEGEEVAEVVIPEPSLPLEYPNISSQDLLTKEKALTGFYISSHPFDSFVKDLQGIPSALPLAKLDDIEDDKKSYLVAGVITSLENKVSKASGKKRVEMEISDGPENRKLMIYANNLDKLKDQGFVPGSFIAAEIKVKADFMNEDGPKIMTLEDCWNFEKYESRQARSLFIAMEEEGLKDLQRISEKHPIKDGQVPMKVVVYLPVSETSYNKIELGSTVRIPNTPEAIKELKNSFSPEQIKFGFDREFRFEAKAYKNDNKNKYRK